LARKSNWRPGSSQQEPGADKDRYSFGYIGPGVTPLQDITTGVLLLIGAAAVSILVFAFTPNLNLGGSIVAGAATLILLGGSARKPGPRLVGESPRNWISAGLQTVQSRVEHATP
jgi:hypothetical protein